MNTIGTRLQFTKHALDRFNQRIVPLLCEETRNTHRDHRNFKKLIDLNNLFTEVNNLEDNVVKINRFLIVEGNIPIPITFVVECKKKKILTLYTQSGWEKISGKNGISWRWLL